jgi:ribosome-associated toxin RatA of RatAB toxin-antitoxin module
MPLYEETHEIDVSATPADCFDVLTDYERMPQWQTRMVECNVLSYGEDGLAREVQYAIDAKLRTVRYRLAHLYTPPTWIGSRYLGGDFRRFEGDYSLVEKADGTHVKFRLAIDPGIRVPRAVARILGEAVMGRTLGDLKERVRVVSSGAQ